MQLRKPAFREVVPDFIACGLGIGVAAFFDWQTTDLVWSLWLSSLVLGYVSVLAAFAAMIIGDNPLDKSFFERYGRTQIVFGGLAMLFMFSFFTLHFCGFHAGHSVFLFAFFPLEDVPGEDLFDSFMNPYLLWKTTLTAILPLYGYFLIPALIAERKNIFAPIVEARQSNRQGKNRKSMANMQSAFSRPYVNVIRMHILIFFFGLCHALEIESFIVFTVVYLVYFFPWKAFRGVALLDNAHDHV